MSRRLQQRLTILGGRPAAFVVWLIVALLLAITNLHDSTREYVFDALQSWHWQLFGVVDNARPAVWIIAIDDASIAHANAWPYPREYLADLIERAATAGVDAIGLDIFLPDNSGDLDADAWLAGTLHATADLVLAHPLAEHRFQSARAPDPLALSAVDPDSLHDSLLASPWPLAPNYGDTDRAASGHGFINDDWIDEPRLRRMPLLVTHEGAYYPAFAAELVRVGLEQGRYVIQATAERLGAIDIVGDERRLRIKVDRQGIMRPRFRPPQAARMVSAQSVLDADGGLPFGPGDIVIIGATALGVKDTAWTVFGEVPGVEVHAQIVESILEQNSWWRPSFLQPVELGLAVAAMLTMLFLAPMMTSSLALLLWVGISAGLLIASLSVMQISHLLLDPSLAIGSAGLVFVTLYAMRIMVERQRRRAVEKERMALETEMEVARDIQNSIMARPDRIEGLPSSIRVEAELVQSNFVGGDFFDVFMLDDERLFMVVADVSGKGWSGAFFMAIVKAFFQIFARNGGGDPAKIVAQTERAIARSNPHELFVTAIVGVLDTRTGQLSLCNAGHPPPVLISEGQAASSLETIDAPPIAMIEGFEFQASHHQLRNGQTLLLFTDGLADLSDRARGDSMGDLRQFLDKQRDGRSGVLPAKQIVERARRLGGVAEDDITLLVVRYA